MYEDAVQHACGTANQLDAIVTRNLNDFKNASWPVSPGGFLNHVKAHNRRAVRFPQRFIDDLRRQTDIVRVIQDTCP